MTEKLYYNEEIKQKFLESIENEVVRKICMYPLRTASKTERIKGKDLYDMDLDEIGTVMSSLSPSTETAAYNNVFRLEEYLVWAVEHGYRQSNIIPLDGIDKVEWAKQFVATYRRSVFTREQVIAMSEQLINYTDQAILLSLFEGISGTGNSEILNLRIQDITNEDGQYYAKLHDTNKGSRVIPISNLLAKTLEMADREHEYISNNGIELASYVPHNPYEDSLMIFKKAKRGKQGGALNTFFVNRKFNLYKDVFNIKHLNRQHIRSSGMMHMAHDLYIKDGGHKREHLTIIADQFDTPSAIQGNSIYRNPTVIKRVVESEEFKDLYGYKIQG